MKNLETLLKDYADHVAERATKGIPPLPLNAEQTNCITKLLEQDSTYDSSYLLDLLINRVPPGVDDAAYIKASWLTAIVNSEKYCKSINPEKAIEILGTMIGGYNVNSLVEILKGENSLLAKKAAEVLKNIVLVYDSANEIYELSQNNIYAKEVVNSWANAEWFINKKVLEEEITCLVFKVDGETNTDDLSPAVHATTRPDIPMHALAMLEFKKPDGLKILDNLKKQNLPIAYVGDVVGTGSSRKSAINSLIWHIGEDIAFVPNKKTGGIIIGSKIAPIFFNTAQDSGALPIEADVSNMKTGDVIKIYPYKGIIKKIKKDSNTEKRAKTFGLIGVAFGLSFFLGNIFVVIFAKNTNNNFIIPVLIASIIPIINFLLVFFYLPETKPNSDSSKSKTIFKNPLKALFTVFKEEKIKKLSLAFFIYFIAFTGLTNILIFFLQESLNWTTKASSGTLVVVGIIAIIVQGGLIGPLVKQFGEMRLTLFGSGFILVACALLITAPKENATINIYSAVSFLAVGAGLITPTLRALISKKLDIDKQGSILSNLQGLQSLGGVLGIAMAGRVYDSFGPKSPFIAGSVILLFMIYLIAEGKNNNSFKNQKLKVF